MHIKNITWNVLSIVLGAFVSHVYSFEILDPVIQIYGTQGLYLKFPDYPEIRDISLSVFLVTDSRDIPLIQNAYFATGWNYENRTFFLTPGQKARFEFTIYGDRAIYKSIEYQAPVWPGNVEDENKICEKSETTVKGRKVCAGELIFEDNFDLLSTPIWTGEYRIPLDVDDADFVMYSGHSYTQHGNFYVRPIVTDEVPNFNESTVRAGQINLGRYCTGIVNREQECKRQAKLFRIVSPIVSTSLNTKDSFTFRYGKIEVRAKLPKGDWLFPLITLEPKWADFGRSDYASGQMRIAFIRSNEQLQTKDGKAIDGSYLFGGVVLNTGESGRETWLRSVHGPEHWGNQFHNYTLTWTATSISLGCDGKTYATLTGGFDRYPLSRMAPFDKEFYISIGVSAGGISDFPDGSVSGRHEKPWNNTDPKGELKFYNARHKWRPTWKQENHYLLIDHVKVWAL